MRFFSLLRYDLGQNMLKKPVKWKHDTIVLMQILTLDTKMKCVETVADLV